MNKAFKLITGILITIFVVFLILIIVNGMFF